MVDNQYFRRQFMLTDEADAKAWEERDTENAEAGTAGPEGNQ